MMHRWMDSRPGRRILLFSPRLSFHMAGQKFRALFHNRSQLIWLDLALREMIFGMKWTEGRKGISGRNESRYQSLIELVNFPGPAWTGHIDQCFPTGADI